MSKRKRFVALAICTVMLLVLFLSSAYVAREANHDCVGEGCPVCEYIAQVEQALRGFGMALLALLSAFAILAACRSRFGIHSVALPVCGTPVTRKTRLND